ncbi:hypothetical protein, partial [Escherichia coli]
MQERHTEQDYRALLIADTPIIDAVSYTHL